MPPTICAFHLGFSLGCRQRGLFEEGVRLQAELTLHDTGIVAIQGNIDTSGGRTAAECFRRSLLAQGPHQVDLASERIKLGPEWARAEEGAGLASHGPGDGLLAGETVIKMLAAVLGGRCRSLRLGVRYPAFPFQSRTYWKQDT